MDLGMVSYSAIFIGTVLILSAAGTVQAGDPFEKPKSQVVEVEQQEGLAFDQLNW
jgi:hypothetical protein